jgi:hypothetical protein
MGSRQPTAIQEAKGAYVKNPSRRNPHEPTVGRPLGSAPKDWPPELAAIWKEIKSCLAPGVATRTDRFAFRMMVRLTWKMEHEDIGNPISLLTGSERSGLITLWSRFGMTPVDRTRVEVPKAVESKLKTFMKRAPQAAAPTPPPTEVPAVN